MIAAWLKRHRQKCREKYIKHALQELHLAEKRLKESQGEPFNSAIIRIEIAQTKAFLAAMGHEVRP